jgi:6-phosphogluconolactonase
MFVYFGTYTKHTSRGIYVIRFDADTGAMSAPELAVAAKNPTWVSLDPSGHHLYATGELTIDPAPPSPLGGAAAYAIDRSSGKLTFINQEPTGGAPTTHSVVDATDRMLILANYNAAYVAALPILPDGRLCARSALIDERSHGPLGPNSKRQDQAHTHSVTLSPDNRFVYACDLGLDRVFIYRIDPAAATLTPNVPADVAAPPGAGPRHSRFSPDRRNLYVTNEMGASVTRYAFDASNGALAQKESISTLPSGVVLPDNTVAELRFHPSGKFLFVSNRGHDSLVVYHCEPATGHLTTVEIVPCGGKHPRNFALDPSGQWLLCANRDTNNVVLFAIDQKSGKLSMTGKECPVPEAVCVAFDTKV